MSSLGICVTNDHGFVSFVVITIWPFSHSWFITRFVKRLTWQAPYGAGAAYPSGAPEFTPGFLHALVGCMLFIVSNYMSLHVFGSMLWCMLRFPHKTIFGWSLFPLVLSGVHVLLILFVFNYIYWFPTLFPCQMLFMSFNNNTTGATCGAGTTNPSGTPEFNPGF